MSYCTYYVAKFLSSRLTLLNRKEGGREGEKEEESRKRKSSQRVGLPVMGAKQIHYVGFPTRAGAASPGAQDWISVNFSA